jgi:small-conductance mechanosensitive channel
VVFAPLSDLMARVARSLPLVVVAVVALVALVVLLRAVGLFFDAIARRDTEVEWMPADLAVPTSLLVRAGVVVLFLVLAAPLLTGNDDGALARAGMIALAAVGLASTPVLASAAVGVAVVYGRKVRVGDFVETGGRTGRVVAMTLLEVQLEDEGGAAVRVPHLVSLVTPTRVDGTAGRPEVTLSVAPSAAQARVREVLLSAARAVGDGARADLVAFDADGAHYRVSVQTSARDAKHALAAATLDALVSEGIALGRRTHGATIP